MLRQSDRYWGRSSFHSSCLCGYPESHVRVQEGIQQISRKEKKQKHTEDSAFLGGQFLYPVVQKRGGGIDDEESAEAEYSKPFQAYPSPELEQHVAVIPLSDAEQHF